jgi:hypothetical protein
MAKMETLKMKKATALLFVYNARSGKGNALWDSARKLLAPSTYECNLCSITYGAFGEDRTWKRFREQVAVEMLFLHKDEFLKRYASKFGHSFTFPIVLAETGNGLEVCVGTEELQALPDVGALIDLLQERELP